jgi:excisionase family DNA binding protein
MSPFMTVKEAAAFLRLSDKTLYRWVSQKRVPARHHGAKVLFHRDELEAWSAGQIEMQPAEPSLSPFERARQRIGSLKTERMNCDSPKSDSQRKGA